MDELKELIGIEIGLLHELLGIAGTIASSESVDSHALNQLIARRGKIMESLNSTEELATPLRTKYSDPSPELLEKIAELSRLINEVNKAELAAAQRVDSALGELRDNVTKLMHGQKTLKSYSGMSDHTARFTDKKY